MKRKRIRLRVNKKKLAYFEMLLVGVMLVSLVMLGVALAGYAKNRKTYADARAQAVSTPAPIGDAPIGDAPTAVATPAATLPPAATPTPVPLETPPVSVDFETLQAEGRHVRAWIYSAGTEVNYPVVYYSNNEYYLTHDYTGKRSDGGALFFDTGVGKPLVSDNLIIYGHHMKDRSMFGSLLQYQKQDYYDAHPTMYLLTPDKNYRIDLISGRYTKTEAKYFPLYFESAEKKQAFTQTAVAESDFTPADIAFRPDARLVTLVTCAYSNYIDDARYQLVGWLMEIG